MNSTRCPIWNTPAEERPSSRDSRIIVSPRAGGLYEITRTVEGGIPNWTDQDKLLLTTWIVDQHRSGEECPLITSSILGSVQSRPLLKYSSKLDRFFKYLAKNLTRIGQSIIIRNPASEGSSLTRQAQELCAWIECIDGDELDAIVRLLVEQNLFSKCRTSITLTAKGYERLEEVEQQLESSTQAFVAMWFDPSMEGAYSDGIDPAVRETGYTPLRIDRKEHANKIDDEIIAEIKRSKFLIADFTCGTFTNDNHVTAVARGGVYYEAGFAQGLGIPVIWCCRNDCINHVHFDTRQFAHIIWNDAEDLRKRLRDRIIAVIGEQK